MSWYLIVFITHLVAFCVGLLMGSSIVAKED